MNIINPNKPEMKNYKCHLLEINRNYHDLNNPEKLFHLCKSPENFLKSFPQLNSIKFQEKSIDD